MIRGNQPDNGPLDGIHDPHLFFRRHINVPILFPMKLSGFGFVKFLHTPLITCYTQT